MNSQPSLTNNDAPPTYFQTKLYLLMNSQPFLYKRLCSNNLFSHKVILIDELPAFLHKLWCSNNLFSHKIIFNDEFPDFTNDNALRTYFHTKSHSLVNSQPSQTMILHQHIFTYSAADPWISRPIFINDDYIDWYHTTLSLITNYT